MMIVQRSVLSHHHACLATFADCNAPPLYLLLTKYRSQLYVKPTILYDTIKESIGYASLLCHTNMAFSMYGWIVMKVSARRLRLRYRLSLIMLISVAIGACRVLIFLYFREKMEGIYVSYLLQNAILIPCTVMAMLYYYFLTARAVGGE